MKQRPPASTTARHEAQLAHPPRLALWLSYYFRLRLIFGFLPDGLGDKDIFGLHYLRLRLRFRRNLDFRLSLDDLRL